MIIAGPGGPGHARPGPGGARRGGGAGGARGAANHNASNTNYI